MGTPPIDIYGIVDTGSDLTWTQCAPCDGCNQKSNPPFDPSKSSTYSDISCESNTTCDQCSPENQCMYDYRYVDGSFTKGVYAKESVTMTSTSGENVSFDIIFGCSHNSGGDFNDPEIMGIVSLGLGGSSFVTQIASVFGSRSFSHCFTTFGSDPNLSSKISFGNDSKVSGVGVVSTPLISRKDESLYVVALNGISVGDKYLPFHSSSVSTTGKVVLDSGTPLMHFPQDLYDRLVAEVKKQIPLNPIYIVYVSESSTTTGEFGIYGNLAQSNFLIGYDIEQMTISFNPTDCTKY
ncbi:aspartic proteinase CDR1-like [Corylus avellana]|uniref:aspartic proteinase CDR1-like n=1 Tax=Corylus avellana TaxID=13451 RepID=UPI00286C027A|nr:aspartic proteinase CDR1-like [Corylus avellana]